jgi:hypothetical protein
LGAGVATLLSFVVYWQVKVWVAARYFPVEYPFRRINLFFTLGLSLSVVVALCPDFFDLWLRSAIVLVVAASVFLLKLMQPSILKKLWLRFKKGVG